MNKICKIPLIILSLVTCGFGTMFCCRCIVRVVILCVGSIVKQLSARCHRPTQIACTLRRRPRMSECFSACRSAKLHNKPAARISRTNGLSELWHGKSPVSPNRSLVRNPMAKGVGEIDPIYKHQLKTIDHPWLFQKLDCQELFAMDLDFKERSAKAAFGNSEGVSGGFSAARIFRVRLNSLAISGTKNEICETIWRSPNPMTFPVHHNFSMSISVVSSIT